MPISFLCFAVAAVPQYHHRSCSPQYRRFASVFDANNQHILGLTKSKELAVWDAKTGETIRVLKGNIDPIVRARLTADGMSVLGQSLNHQSDWSTWGTPKDRGRERAIRLWDIGTGKIRWTIIDGIFDAFSRDQRRIYGVSSRFAPHLTKPKLVSWDANTGRQTFSFPAFAPASILSNRAQESADGKRLLYSDVTGTRIFELKSRTQIHFADDKSTGIVVAPAAFTESGERFFFAGPMGTGMIDLISIRTGTMVNRAVFPNRESPSRVGWLTKSEGFVAYANGSWYSFRRSSGLVKHTQDSEGGYDLIVSPDERSFITWAIKYDRNNEAFRTSGFDTRTCKKRWERPGVPIVCLPDAQLIIEDEDMVRFVDIRTGIEKRSVKRAVR
ncbi:MAG: hypothetical protein SFX74_01650 [Fimbriimonadaceae bacterium]|nr:hypothetical protein [Fimbriimonadaceae bacterium]